MKLLIALLIFTFIHALWGAEKQKLTFDNGKSLNVEVAKKMRDREVGLMNRLKMPENEGMLFIFDYSHKLSFWMKDTYIPLTIGFFDKDKVLKETQDMAAQNLMEKTQDLKAYKSQCQCLYALEVNQGWFKKNKIKPGAKFTLQPIKNSPE